MLFLTLLKHWFSAFWAVICGICFETVIVTGTVILIMERGKKRQKYILIKKNIQKINITLVNFLNFKDKKVIK